MWRFSCCHQNLQASDVWLVLISPVCSASRRPHRAEEHWQHLLHECCPPSSVQLVRLSLFTCRLSPYPPVYPTSPSQPLLTPSYYFPPTIRTFSSHLLFYSLPAWFLLTVRNSHGRCSFVRVTAE